MKQDDRIILGKINGSYGIKGYVKVFSDTRPRDAILQYSHLQVYLKNEWVQLAVMDAKSQAKSLVFLFEGFADRTISMQLMGALVAIMPEQLPPLEKNEYFWRDLIGLKVYNQEGISFGMVTSIMETGANDVLVCSDDSTERLVPFIQGTAITGIDLEEGIIRVDWDADF